MPLPELRTIDVGQPIKNYLSGQQRQRQEARQDTLMQRDLEERERRWGREDIALEREQIALEREKEQQSMGSIEDYTKQQLMGLNPDSPTFEEDKAQVVDRVSIYAAELGIPPDRIREGAKMVITKLTPEGVRRLYQEEMFGGPVKRETVRGADDYLYYQDTGERVLPGVDKPKKEPGTTTAIKEFEYAEKNPKFAAQQKAKIDKKATDNVKKGTFKDSSALRKEFLSQSKEYQKVRDSYTRVLGSTKDPSPAGDLSLIFNYMKMLDPGSVVRESEFATAAASGSYGQRIQAGVNRVLSGQRLAPEMREDFLSKSGELLKGMQEQHRKRENSYKGIAGKNNLPVDEVVVDITAPQEFKEGQTATGPNGEKIVFTNGEWGPLNE